MSSRRVFSLRFIAFSLTPLLLIMLAAETTLRFKYFFAHDYDWHYLTTPFPLNARSLPFEQQMPLQVRIALEAQTAPPDQAAPQTVSAAPAVPKLSPPAPTTVPPSPATPETTRASQAVPVQPAQTATMPQPPATPGTTRASQLAPAQPALTVPPSAPAPVVEATPQPQHAVQTPQLPQAQTVGETHATAPQRIAPQDQMVFLWPTPCVSGMVYSTDRRTVLPRTWDENCFRGDRMARQDAANEYRIAFLGGSTVQDFQSDEEMMTAQFKHVFPRTPAGKRLVVINAGRSGFDSRLILEDYRSRVSRFSIDLVLYYEAWNEQPGDVKPSKQADQVISTIHNQFHSTLYHRSMLYTYMVEKYAFLSTSRARFWRIDVNNLRRNFTELVREVRSHGTQFVFVTQVVRFPRRWKGVDTFDYERVDVLLDHLKADPRYVYDVTEISALNQRLALLYTLRLCRENGIPVIDILDPMEALGEAGRAELFMDVGHLTAKGDKFVGELIARRLNVSD